MQGFNHVAGGVAFTGIFASFSNVNIFEKPEYIAATVVFSLLADVDHTRSLIGKVFFPVAKWINTKFGHRTITHSLLFYVGLLVIIGALESFFSFSRAYFIIAAFAYGSHIIFDMCTKQGVILFYPMSSRPAVLPGNPNLRLAVNDLRSEAVVFLVFVSLTFFCLPLFANGFWLSFRKYFLTAENVNKEFQQSSDYLILSYDIQGKKTARPKESLILEIEGQNFILLTGNVLEKVAAGDINLKDFHHSGKPRKSEVISIFQASPDSVQKLISGKIIRSGQLQSNSKIQYFDNAIMNESNTVSINWKRDFVFFMNDTINQNTPKIAQLESQKIEQLRIYQAEIQEREKLKKRLSEIVKSIPGATDHEAGKLITRKKEIEHRIENLTVLLEPDFTIHNQEINRLSEAPKVYLSANLIIEKL
jgi:inner membrane protein